MPLKKSPSTESRWLAYTLGFLGSILALVLLLVVIVDPFVHYHGPWFGYGMVSWTEAYTNPGIARNLPHDAVVIGGSYVQNTKVSEVNQAFGVQAIKLTNAGGTPANLHRLLDLALNSGPRVRWAMVAVPITKFISPNLNDLRSSLPEYLYDDQFWNDVSYWFNRDVLYEMAKSIVKGGWKPETPDDPIRYLDEAYSWYGQHKKDQGKAAVLAHYQPPAPGPEKPVEQYLAAARAQFERHLRPVLDAHPEVEFHFVFPPFSRLLWRDAAVAGNLRALLAVKKYMVEELLRYPQVHIDDFMRMEPLVSDLSNYKDKWHFLPPVSSAMIQAMKDESYRVSQPLSSQDLEQFYQFAASYRDADIPVAKDGEGAPEVQDFLPAPEF